MNGVNGASRDITRAWVDCLVAAALFGAATPASKVLLGSVGPFTLAGLLYVGAALATLPAFLRTRWVAPSRANTARLAAAVLFGGMLAPALLMLGLSRATASSASLWLNLEGPSTALISWLFFREQLGGRVWLAVVIMFGAGALLSAGDSASDPVGALLVLLACLCWGVDNNVTAVNDGFTPAQATCIKGGVAGAVNLAMGAAWDPGFPPLQSVGLALVLGALSYGLSLVLYIRASQKLGATRSQVLFSTGPFAGLVLAWVFLREPVLATQLLAGALKALGVWLVQAAQHDHPHAHPALTHTHPHRHDDGHHAHVHSGLPDDTEHTHEHAHAPQEHVHPHVPDLHHRH